MSLTADEMIFGLNAPLVGRHPSFILEGHCYQEVWAGLSELDIMGPEELSPEVLKQDLRWMAQVGRTLEAMRVRWAAELDRQEPEHCRPLESATDFLHMALRLTPSEAYDQVRVGRRLGRMHQTAAAFFQGWISADHVSVICRALDQVRDKPQPPIRGPLEEAEDAAEAGLVREPPLSGREAVAESHLLDAALQMDPKALLRHWRRLHYKLDQQGEQEAENKQRSRRWLSLWETWSGNYGIEGELDAESGALLKTALNSILGPRRGDDDRRPAQRRADALADLARFRLDHGDLPTHGGARPHLTVLADVETLKLLPGSAAADLDWRLPVTGETARRLACDAEVTPILIGPNGDPLRVGRTRRTISPKQRRALAARDRGCAWPGCQMPPEFTDGHHLRHWIDGGGTDLEELALLCRHHHVMGHEGGHRLTRTADGRLVARAP
jgi:hypothetical protein